MFLMGIIITMIRLKINFDQKTQFFAEISRTEKLINILDVEVMGG